MRASVKIVGKIDMSKFDKKVVKVTCKSCGTSDRFNRFGICEGCIDKEEKFLTELQREAWDREEEERISQIIRTR